MKKEIVVTLQCVLLIALFGIAGVMFYKGIIHPWFVQPNEDREFLSRHPTRTEVLAYFQHQPHEAIKSGERFQMTGWRPLPTRAASHQGFAYGRMCGTKIYIFFDSEDRVEEFVIATS